MKSRFLLFGCVMALLVSVVAFCNAKILPNFIKVEHELGMVDDTNRLPDYDPRAEMDEETLQALENASPNAAVLYNSETGKITVTEIVTDGDSTGTEPYNPSE